MKQQPPESPVLTGPAYHGRNPASGGTAGRAKRPTKDFRPSDAAEGMVLALVTAVSYAARFEWQCAPSSLGLLPALLSRRQ